MLVNLFVLQLCAIKEVSWILLFMFFIVTSNISTFIKLNLAQLLFQLTIAKTCSFNFHHSILSLKPVCNSSKMHLVKNIYFHKILSYDNLGDL